MADEQKPVKPTKPRRRRKPFYDPAKLQALPAEHLRILQMEIANPGISARKIKELTGMHLSIAIINDARRSPAYQAALYDSSLGAIELIMETQGQAIRKLRAQIDAKDERISQRAALFFGESARDIHVKRAEFELERELAKDHHDKPTHHTVRVEMADNVPIIGKPDIVTTATPIPQVGYAGQSGTPDRVKTPDAPTPGLLPIGVKPETGTIGNNQPSNSGTLQDALDGPDPASPAPMADNERSSRSGAPVVHLDSSVLGIMISDEDEKAD